MTAIEDRPAPGEARGPGKTLREQLLEDPTPPPAALLEESYEFLGDEDIPYTNYTDPGSRRSASSTTCGRRSGSGRATSITSRSRATTTCTRSATPRRSSCAPMPARSRRTTTPACTAGTALKPAETCGFSKDLRCPFHGWTWSLDGQLVDLPGSWDFPHAGAESHRLPEMPVGVWGGFVFVNFDPGRRTARGLPRGAAAALGRLGARGPLHRDPRAQAAAVQLEGCGRGVPRGVPRARDPRGGRLGDRGHHRLRRVRAQRLAVHPHHRAQQPAAPTAAPPSRSCSRT